jgi:ELWxxDGT repeat protein
VLNNVTYFAADDGVHGSELWRSDGTSAGTHLVKDINPGWYSANINEITAANGKIYFSAYTDAEGQQPWVSDGTTDGTQLLKNIPGSYLYGSYPTQFVNVNGTVFFITDGYSVQSEIWKTDGTEAGTVYGKRFSAYRWRKLYIPVNSSKWIIVFLHQLIQIMDRYSGEAMARMPVPT